MGCFDNTVDNDVNNDVVTNDVFNADDDARSAAVIAELNRLEVVAGRGDDSLFTELDSLAERALAGDQGAEDVLAAVVFIGMLGSTRV